MSLWNDFACSTHSKFLQQCFLTEPNLTFIMAPEKLLPNDTMSPPDAEIKGDVSNRNAVSDGKAGARGAQGVKEARPCRGCEGLTHAACSQGRGCTSGRRSSFSRKNTLQNPSEKNPKCVSLGSLDTLMMMKHKNSILPRQRSQLSNEDKGSPPCALLLQGGESSSSSCI